MDAVLIILAVPAGLWALARIAWSARGVALANRARTRELRTASGARHPIISSDSAEALKRADAFAARAVREDYSLTGAILAGLGAVAMFSGRALAYGQWAVGLYFGGSIAIVAGVGLAIAGAVLRILARPLIEPQEPAS